MAITLPTLTPVEDSLLLTLYCKALDSRLPKPLLSDATADEIVRKLDYDFEQFKVNNNFLRNVALRSKKMDEVASAFIRHHPDAVGLDLGVGLDTRLVRLAPPATVDWYDVDFPAVIDVRKRVVPDRPNVHVIGADVTDRDWLNTVPSDRPAVIVADGLMGFLTKDDFVSLPKPAHRSLPHRRDGFQQLHTLCRLGKHGRTRHQVCLRPPEVSRRRRPPGTRNLES